LILLSFLPAAGKKNRRTTVNSNLLKSLEFLAVVSAGNIGGQPIGGQDGGQELPGNFQNLLRLVG
jgi:hypothetical protein